MGNHPPSPHQLVAESARNEELTVCRSSIVAAIEKPYLMEHQRLCIHCCLLLKTKVKKNHAGLFLDRRPIQNRPLEETNLPCLAKFEYQRSLD